MAPYAGEAWGGFVQEHVLSRSVRDSALLLDIEAQGAPGEPYAQPAKERPWLEEVGADPGKLKIAFTQDTLYAGETHPDCAAATDDAIQLLQDLGHTVVEAKPPMPVADLVHAYFITVATGVAWFCTDAAARHGRKPRASDFEPATWLLAQIGWKHTGADLLAAQVTMQRAAREVAAFFEEYDVFVSSSLARPPTEVGELYPSGSKETQLKILGVLPLKALLNKALHELGTQSLAATPNTQLFNQTGQPAMSVPLYWNEAGLPIGTQVASKFGDEATLFRLAAQLEEARPWAGRKPPGI